VYYTAAGFIAVVPTVVNAIIASRPWHAPTIVTRELIRAACYKNNNITIINIIIIIITATSIIITIVIIAVIVNIRENTTQIDNYQSINQSCK